LSAPDPVLLDALAHHQRGDVRTAEMLYARVLAGAPDDVNALHLLGRLRHDDGRPAEAVPPLERAAVLVGDGAAAGHAPLFSILGNALRATGRLDEARAAYERAVVLDPALAEPQAGLGLTLLLTGFPAAAAAAYETALRLCPDDPDILNNLAHAYAGAGRMEDGITACRRALTVRPDHPDAAANLARLLAVLGRWDEARAAYLMVADHLERAAAAAPGDPEPLRRLAGALTAAGREDAAAATLERVAALAPDDAEARLALGRLRHGQRRVEAAEAAYRAALALRPDHGETLTQLAALLLEDERHEEVVALAGDNETTDPALAGFLYIRGTARIALEEMEAAIADLGRCVALRPDFAAAWYKRGSALAAAGRLPEAVADFARAVELKPDDPATLMELGNALTILGRPADARPYFDLVMTLRPLVTWPAATEPAAFSVLLLNAPGAGNTPAEYLVGRAEYQSHFLALLPGSDPWPAAQRAACDVVVNLISDPDRTAGALEGAAELIDRLGRPTINPPDRIAATDRETIARNLADVPGCHVPRTVRMTGDALLAIADDPAPAGFAFPFLVRLAGSHGGTDFEKVDTGAALAAFVGQGPERRFYLSEFVDCRSEDGYVRKYRMIFVADEILPYHLAIADQWKVHHYRTEMETTPWMQEEERRFLAQPETVFGAGAMDALANIRQIVGLDFFGIDCALDRAGRVVVFEVNATMLIHGHNRALPYKDPHVARIKQAFDRMLARAAGRA
jgi:tetratricopeptide (TPR) repeat protein